MVEKTIELLYHDGCSRAHWTLGEVRKCTGRWTYLEEIKTIMYTAVSQEELETLEALRAGKAVVTPKKNGTKCGHPEFSDGYCAEMICANYYSRNRSDA